MKRAKIVKIGNSRGVRLPKPMLEQAGLGEEVALEVVDATIVISSAGGVRKGWAQAARAMAARSDDQLLDEPTDTRFDAEEWHW